MTRIAPVLIACLLLAACQTNPKQLVLDLDTTDKAWESADCIAARKAAATYNDREGVRTATAVAGMIAGVPVAGALVNAALTAAQQDEREDLNNQLRAACISDPLAAKASRKRK